MTYLKILLLNILIILTSIALAFLGTEIDTLFNAPAYPLYIIGVVLVLIGLIFRVMTSIHFYKNNIKVLELRTQKKLLKTGIYKVSRNPLYVGIILICLGVVVYFGTLFGLLLWFLAVLFCDWWVRTKEEKMIEKKFSKEYLDYKNVTPRWL